LFGKKDDQEKKGLMDQSKESWMAALEASFLGASMKADPVQKVMMNAELVKIKQNEEILEELKKLNSSK
jgi:hypothetical protein